MSAATMWYAAGASCVVAFLVWTFIDWRKKHPKQPKAVTVQKADDIPDLIAAAKLAQSVGCQAGVDAMLGVVADRLKVKEAKP